MNLLLCFCLWLFIFKSLLVPELDGCAAQVHFSQLAKRGPSFPNYHNWNGPQSAIHQTRANLLFSYCQIEADQNAAILLRSRIRTFILSSFYSAVNMSARERQSFLIRLQSKASNLRIGFIQDENVDTKLNEADILVDSVLCSFFS